MNNEKNQDQLKIIPFLNPIREVGVTRDGQAPPRRVKIDWLACGRAQAEELAIEATPMDSFEGSFHRTSSDAHKKYWWLDRGKQPTHTHTCFVVQICRGELGATMERVQSLTTPNPLPQTFFSFQTKALSF